jgi:hypothetical protein
MLYYLNHIFNSFPSGYFLDGVSLGWPGNMILPISASQVSRISGVSHQHLAYARILDPFQFIYTAAWSSICYSDVLLTFVLNPPQLPCGVSGKLK